MKTFELDRIYNMDCLVGMKDIPDHSVDLVITDPPYLIDTVGAGIYKQPSKRYIKELEEIKDGFSAEVLDELCRVMKRINIYLFCSQKQIITLLDYFVKARGCNYNILTWHKTNPTPACSNKYLNDTEFIMFFREKGVRIYGEFETKKTYFVTPLNKGDKRKYNHPTPKPVSIIGSLLVNSSQPGDVVLDPFIGSGTTAVAAMRNGRHYLGFELNKEYWKSATDRVASEKLQLKLF